MTASLQTYIALTLVVITAVSFVWCWWHNRKKTGCRGGCGCTGKQALKRQSWDS